MIIEIDDNHPEKHPLYPQWSDMLGRCYDPDHPRYPYEGARGIKVCDEWRLPPDGFRNFVRDAETHKEVRKMLKRIVKKKKK